MLEEKIANEFQRYFLSMMATSKENIFAHSDEIEVRKQIKNELYELIGTLTEEQKEILHRMQVFRHVCPGETLKHSK